MLSEESRSREMSDLNHTAIGVFTQTGRYCLRSPGGARFHPLLENAVVEAIDLAG